MEGYGEGGRYSGSKIEGARGLGDNLCLVFAMLLLLFSKFHKKLANKILEAQAGAVNIIITYTVAYVCACLCVGEGPYNNHGRTLTHLSMTASRLPHRL